MNQEQEKLILDALKFYVKYVQDMNKSDRIEALIKDIEGDKNGNGRLQAP